MTPEERENQRQEIDRLCLAVITEKDPNKLLELVEVLNDLLERRVESIRASNKAGAA